MGEQDMLKVITYNILHGQGIDGRIDLKRQADVISLSGADLVLLNEVDVNTRRSGNLNEPVIFGELLGMNAAFGAKFPYQGGEFGNAILSRHPIRKTRTIVLPPGARPQSCLYAEIEAHGRIVHLIAAHLSLELDASLLQLQSILEEANALHGPVIVAGDLNRLADTDTDPALVLEPTFTDAWRERVRMLEAAGHSESPDIGFTFPSTAPNRRIDFIFYKGGLDLPSPDSIYTIDSLASDHLPLVATLRFRDRI